MRLLFGTAALVALVGACGRTEPNGLVSGAAGVTGASGSAAGTSGLAGITGAAGALVEPSSINAVLRGPGCGKPLPATQEQTKPGTIRGYTHYTVMGTGATLTGTVATKAGPRTFWVRVPADYDPDHAYRIVYLGQGCGGYQVADTNTYPLFKEVLGGTEQAIYVALDIPENMANLDCYDVRDGLASQELEAFELFHKVIDENYCVDNNRVFAGGYSSGGTLANLWGCYFAGDGQRPAEAPATPRRFAARYHVRAQLAVAGGEPHARPACGGPVAALFIHDQMDVAHPLADAQAALQRVGRMNGCETASEDAALQEPWHPEVALLAGVCKRFTTCPADYPVVFCSTVGQGRTDQRDRVTAAFSLFADELPR